MEIERDQRAAKHKLEGNRAFTQGRYADAAKEYTLAMQLCPNEKSFYGNRSAAWAKMGLFDQALTDASSAVSMDSTNPRAYLRLAVAYQGLAQWSDALEAYEQILRLVPDNEVAAEGRRECISKLSTASTPSPAAPTSRVRLESTDSAFDTETTKVRTSSEQKEPDSPYAAAKNFTDPCVLPPKVVPEQSLIGAAPSSSPRMAPRGSVLAGRINTAEEMEGNATIAAAPPPPPSGKAPRGSVLAGRSKGATASGSTAASATSAVAPPPPPPPPGKAPRGSVLAGRSKGTTASGSATPSATSAVAPPPPPGKAPRGSVLAGRSKGDNRKDDGAVPPAPPPPPPSSGSVGKVPPEGGVKMGGMAAVLAGITSGAGQLRKVPTQEKDDRIKTAPANAGKPSFRSELRNRMQKKQQSILRREQTGANGPAAVMDALGEEEEEEEKEEEPVALVQQQKNLSESRAPVQNKPQSTPLKSSAVAPPIEATPVNPDLPEWKRKLLEDKAKKQAALMAPQLEKERLELERRERIANMPTWKRNLVLKKQQSS